MNEFALERYDVETFCRTMQPRLIGALIAQGNDQATAWDLSQEALARVVVAWKRVVSADSPEAYCFRMAFNLSKSRWRRRAAERRAVDRWRAGEQSSVDLVPHVSDPNADLHRALHRLSERDRRLVVLRYVAGLSVTETSQVLGMAPGTVKSASSRALEDMREWLTRTEQHS